MNDACMLQLQAVARNAGAGFLLHMLLKNCCLQLVSNYISFGIRLGMCVNLLQWSNHIVKDFMQHAFCCARDLPATARF